MSNKKKPLFIEINIPYAVHKNILEKIEGTEFGTVDAYVTFVLNELLSDESDVTALNEEEEEQVKTRLRDLGYIG